MPDFQISIHEDAIQLLTIGEQGPAGPPGPPGGVQVTYVWAQVIPASSWVITHALNRYPSVTIVDSAGTMVEGDVHYDSANQITLNFVGSFAGNAYLN